MDTRPDTSPADHPPFEGLSVQGFSPYYHVWRLCGLWFQPGDGRVIKIIAVFSQFLFMVVFNFLMFLSLPSARSLDDVMEVLLPLTTTVLASIKAVLIVRKRKSVLELFSIAKQLEVTSADNGEEVKIFQNANRQARQLMILVVTCCFATISFRFAQALLSDQRRLMWKAWMPFDWEHSSSDLPHLFALGFQLIGNYYCGLLYTTFNPFAPYLYLMLVGYLDILAKRLATLGHGNESNKVLEWNLIKCVKYHRLCLRYNQCLYDIFSVAFLVQFIFNGVVICVTAYQLSVIAPSETSKFTFLIFYLMNMTIELFIPCYFASRVRAYSERLSCAVFHSNWNGQPVRFQVAIKMFITGVQRPIVIYTLKGVFVVALPTFVTVCRAAYSLLSCLKGY